MIAGVSDPNAVGAWPTRPGVTVGARSLITLSTISHEVDQWHDLMGIYSAQSYGHRREVTTISKVAMPSISQPTRW